MREDACLLTREVPGAALPQANNSSHVNSDRTGSWQAQIYNYELGLRRRKDMVCSRSVDVVQRWSERIAQRVAPAEVDFAADVGVKYAEGGSARKGLLQRPSTQPGAFGPGGSPADLPLILRALTDAGNWLLWLLSSPDLSNALAAGSLLIALRNDRGHGQASESERPATQTATMPKSPPTMPVSERQAVDLALASLRNRLASAGFPRERATQLARELLKELLTDAADAALFVEALTAVPDGGGRLKSWVRRIGKWGRTGGRQ
jgi:hypothetical protein